MRMDQIGLRCANLLPLANLLIWHLGMLIGARYGPLSSGPFICISTWGLATVAIPATFAIMCGYRYRKKSWAYLLPLLLAILSWGVMTFELEQAMRY